MNPKLSARELQASDIPHIADYWLKSSAEHLNRMGADPKKLPTREQWETMLREQISQPYNEKKSYCLIWEMNEQAIGHCNVNKIKFAEEAFMHLHIWRFDVRKMAFGSELVKMTLPYFFDNLQLQTLYCEPYALNPAPNKTLEKIGFSFVKEYTTIPGAINFEQPVKLWEMTRKKFEELK